MVKVSISGSGRVQLTYTWLDLAGEEGRGRMKVVERERVHSLLFPCLELDI